MKHLFITYIIIFLSVFSIQSQTTKKVLFIGNSYTSKNNLPSIVNNLAISSGDLFIYDSNIPGYSTLMYHASNTITLNKIKSNNWDYVVLQAHSQETSKSQSQKETGSYPFAEYLSNAIRANDECSQPMFYMTWGRENGDAENCENDPWVCTYEEMDDVIKATYILMADNNDTEIAPAGAVWRYIRTNYPTIDLYSDDGSHPSLAGSYAAACALYTMIYKKDPTLITWNSTLSYTDANIIKIVTKIVVFDEIPTWDFTINPAIADYSEVINADEVSFTNIGSDFDSLLWDFGDGETSTETNPIHKYKSTGDYTVSLTVNKCGKSDIKTKTLNITDLSIEEFDLWRINTFPNPVSNTLTIKLYKNYNDIHVIIFDITGKYVIKKSAHNVTNLNINLSTLSSGIYIMKLFTGTHIYTSKISKK